MFMAIHASSRHRARLVAVASAALALGIVLLIALA
jgi:hypothetical protein